MVVHVGVDVTHGVVGHTHAIAVVALLGILVHGVYLLQTRVGLSSEVKSLHKDGPRLVVVLPVLDGCEEFEGRGYLFVDRVVEVVVVEKDDLLHPGVAFLFGGSLLLALVDDLVDAEQLVVDIVELEAEVVELPQNVDAISPCRLSERLPVLLGLVSKNRDR